MTFIPERDPNFETALRAFCEQKTGKPDGWKKKDIVCAASEQELLPELNEYMKQHYGRGLEADDFFRTITQSEYGGDGCSSFCFAEARAAITNAIHFMTEIRSVPCAEAVLSQPQLGNSLLVQLETYNLEQTFFSPDLWHINPQPLYELQLKLGEGAALDAVNKCLKNIEAMSAPLVVGSNMTRRAVLGKDGRPSPLGLAKSWDNFGKTQEQLAAQGEALTWRDLFDTELIDGTPLIVKAARMGKLAEVCEAMPKGESDGLNITDLDRALPDGTTIGSALAETGQLLPVFHGLGSSAEAVAAAARNLTESQRDKNGLNAALLRQKLRAARIPRTGLLERLGISGNKPA